MANEPTKADLELQASALRGLLKDVGAIDTDGNKKLDSKELLTFVLTKYQAGHASEADPFKPLREDIAAIRTARDLQKRYNDHDPAVTAAMAGKANDVSEMAKQRLSELVNAEPSRIKGNLLESTARGRDAEIAAEEAARAAAIRSKDKADATAERGELAAELGGKLPPGAANDPRAAAFLNQVKGGQPSSDAQAAQQAFMKNTLDAMRDKMLKAHPEQAAAIEKQFAAIPIGQQPAPQKDASPENVALQKQIREIRQQLAPYSVEGKALSLDALEETMNAVAGKKPAAKNDRTH